MTPLCHLCTFAPSPHIEGKHLSTPPCPSWTPAPMDGTLGSNPGLIPWWRSEIPLVRPLLGWCPVRRLITKEAAAIFGFVGWWSCVEWIKKWASRKISGIKHYVFVCMFFSIVFQGIKICNEPTIRCVQTVMSSYLCSCMQVYLHR